MRGWTEQEAKKTQNPSPGEWEEEPSTWEPVPLYVELGIERPHPRDPEPDTPESSSHVIIIDLA